MSLAQTLHHNSYEHWPATGFVTWLMLVIVHVIVWLVVLTVPPAASMMLALAG